MNRLVRPVSFTFEPDMVSVFAMASFGAAGAATLNTKNSKGVCQWAANTQVWKGSTHSNTSVTAMQSLWGVYNGMTVTGSGIPASTTVSAVNPGAGTLTLSGNATTSLTGTPLTFSGGQYLVTLGQQITPYKVLDTYTKLLQLDYNWDDIVNARAQTSSTPSSPAAPFLFLLANQTAQANQTFTITGTTDGATGVITAVSSVAGIYPGMIIASPVGLADITAGSVVLAVGTTTITISTNSAIATTNEVLTLTPINPASIIVQCGTLSAATFVAANPASGEILRLALRLSRSTAI